MARVLVVEDDLVAALSIQEFLKETPYTVVASVTSGIAAISAVRKNKPDLVLMDIHLEGDMDGITSATQIREQWDIPIIYLTANTTSQVLERAIATEPFGYLLKPFDRCQLHSTIQVALRRYWLEQQMQQTEQWLATTLMSIADGTIATDTNGCITFMNPAAEMLTGWQQAEALGEAADRVLHLVDPQTRVALENPVLRAIRVGTSISLPNSCILRTKDGLERAIGDTAAPIRNHQGEITGGVIVFQDVTQRMQAEAALRHQVEQEQLIGQIAQRIRQSLDLHDILNTTVAEVRQLLQTDRVIIYQFAPDWSGSVLVESVVAGWRSMLGETLYDPCLAQADAIASYTQGKVSSVQDIYTDELSDCYVKLLAQFQVRANLVIPVLQSEQLWGLLVAQHCAAPRQWQAWEIHLLTQLSNHLSIALQQSQLYHQMRHQVEREQALNRVIQAIRNSLELQTVFATAVAEVGPLLQLDQATIVQYFPPDQVWRHVASYCRTAQIPDPTGQEIPDHSHLFTARLKQLEVVRVDDYSTRTAPQDGATPSSYPGAWLLVPLQVGEQLWGSLSLNHCHQSWIWQDSEVELARTVANQLAIAIQQSQLYQQVQQFNAELEIQVQERTTQLQQAFQFEATLKRITDRVRDSLDEHQILQTVVQELGLAIGVTTCNAALYNLEQQVSTICYEYSKAAQPFQPYTVAMTQFPQGYQQLQQGQHFQFCTTSPLFSEGQAAILACPIFDNQGVLGDLWLIHHAHVTFSQVDIRLVQQVANQCAIALRQSRLYQTAQTQVLELERLNRLKDDFLSTISHELRTPMANIKLATQLLDVSLQRLGVVGEQAGSTTRYMKVLQEECQREISLIDNLLDLSQIEQEMEGLELARIDLSTWIPSTIAPLIDRAAHQSQHLHLHIPDDLTLLTTDPVCLERILIELLTNACKYTPTHGQITVFVQATSTQIQIGVSNSGSEIRANELPYIFDKFYRVPSADPWKHDGTGLGLALVKKRVTQLGASIQVASAEGITTFTLQFPREQMPEF
ncbi:GAF domain-containing protein [Pantanalinema rosaneae CENA516]|uniref:GAF domain-containing protein n=1 Tax=Pantanalinema rosaneae TaxID=1620701 RepID=UPI003D6E7133